MRLHNFGILGALMLFIIAATTTTTTVPSLIQTGADLEKDDNTWSVQAQQQDKSVEFDPVETTVIYVDADAKGGENNGTSWTNAYLELTDALAEARATTETIEIWIAEGTYYPDQSNFNDNQSVAIGPGNIVDANGEPAQEDSERATFLINRPGISLYGGFTGTEDAKGQRVPGENLTILSGDITQDDHSDIRITESPQEINGGNSDNILIIGAVQELLPPTRLEGELVIDNNTVIDGVTISGGQSEFDEFHNDPNPDNFTSFVSEGPEGGAGLLLISTGEDAENSPMISNVDFVGNSAFVGGAIAIIAIEGGQCSPVFSNVDFENNYAYYAGGAIFAEGSDGEVSPTFMNVDFENNLASLGGALSVFTDEEFGAADFYFINTNFEENGSQYGGGAVTLMSNGGGEFDIEFRATTFENNGISDFINTFVGPGPIGPGMEDPSGGAILSYALSPSGMTIDIQNCTFDDNSSFSDGGALFVGSVFSTTTVNIHSTTFENNTAQYGGAIFVDGGDEISGNEQQFQLPSETNVQLNITESIFNDNTASSDGGAVFAESDFTGVDLNIDSTEFKRNLAGDGGAIHLHLDGNSDEIPFSLDIAHSHFEANVARGEYEGGAIFITFEDDQDLDFNIDTTLFNNNIAEADGGAIFIRNNYDEYPEIYSTWNNVTFRDNSCGSEGGAIAFEGEYDGYEITWNLEMNNCEFLHNSDDDSDGAGAAIFFEYGDIEGTISNTIFKNNGGEFDEVEDGGAIEFVEQDDLDLTLINCIFSNNGISHIKYDDPDSGDGLLFINTLFYGADYAALVINDLDDDKPMAFRNCIFWNNNSDVVGLEDAADDIDELGDFSFVDIRNSIIEEDTIQFQPVEGPEEDNRRVAMADVRGNIFADPQFVDTTPGLEDFNLQRTSPAIDAGDAEDNEEEGDFAGEERELGCGIDMGPFEFTGNNVFAGEDREVCRCEFIQLEGVLSGFITEAVWSGGEGTFKDPTDINTVYQATEEELQLGSVTLTLTSTNEDCSISEDEVTFTFKDLVDVVKNCDGTIDISWQMIDQGTDLDVSAWFATIYLVQEDGNIEILDFDDLVEPELTLSEGALELNEEYFISITEVLTDGASTQTTCALPPIMNASPTYTVLQDGTFGPRCDNADIGDDHYTGQVTFTIDRPTYAECPDAIFDVVVSGSALEEDQEFLSVGFDEEVVVENVGEGSVMVALFQNDETDCQFMYEKCLNVPELIHTSSVEDTDNPELLISIEDDIFGTQITADGTTETYDLGVVDPGEDCCFTLDLIYLAEDNCDIDPEVTIETTGDVTFEDNLGNESQDGADLQNFVSNGVVTVVFCTGEGSITVTITDENGLESTVVVTASVPETTPSTDLSPATYYISPCDDVTTVTYGFTVQDPCDLTDLEELNILLNTQTDLVPGFPIAFYANELYTEPRGENGIYVEFTIEDVPAGGFLVSVLVGEEELESSLITVVPSEAPNLEDLACNDNVNVTLDENCEAAVTADMVLEGDNICNDEFIVVVDYGMGEWETGKISRCGTFKYEVFTQAEEFICWGYITGEDKSAPVVPQEEIVVPVVCGDLELILANKDQESQRDDETCLFDTEDNLTFTTWDLVREKGSYDINDIADNCSAKCHLEFQITDLLMENDICEGSMVVRTIKVTDEKGNTSSFTIRFVANQPVLKDDIADTEIDECSNPDAVNNDYLNEAGTYYYELCWKAEQNGALVPVVVRPPYNGKSTSFCGYAISYEDQILPFECEGEKIIRTWTVLDWCTEENTSKNEFEVLPGKTQEIKVGAFSAPAVTCNAMFPDVVSTGGFDCTASLQVPNPVVSVCKGSFDYSIKLYETVPELNGLGKPTGNTVEQLAIYPIRRGSDGRYLITGMPQGLYRVEYLVSTECGVSAEPYSCTFEVKDLTEPVVVCDDELNVSIGGEGISRITVQDVDEGSWDNCELVDLKIRRSLDSYLDEYLNQVLEVSSLDELLKAEETTEDGVVTYWYKRRDVKLDTLIVEEPTKDGQRLFTWWKNEVYFLCCDISKSMDDHVVVEMQAVDKADNKNSCWMDILVENKLTPRCTAPANVNSNCWDFTIDGGDIAQVRAEFGTVEELLASKDLTVDFNCDFVVTDQIKWDPRECSEGTLRRIFTVTAPSTQGIMSSTCTQTITVEKVNDYLITFPGDDDDVCAGDGGVGIQTKSYTCDILAVNADTAIFTASGDECFKRYVTYRVINWCEYDGVSLEPTIVPRDVDCDGNFAEATYVKSFEGDVWIDDDTSIDRKGAIPSDDEFIISFTADQESYNSMSCDNKEYWYTPGYWEYTQVIKVYDDVKPVFEIDTLTFCAFGPSGAAECNGEVMIPFSAYDECTENVEVRTVQIAVNKQNPVNLLGDLYTLTEEGDGLFTISSIPGVGLPVGEHLFVVKIADDCGNVEVREIPFVIVDCKTPAPICISILSVDLMPIVENKEVVGGMNTVWATDFIASSVFDCTPHPNPDLDCDLRYYAVRMDEVTADGLEVPDSRYLNENYRDVEFTCADNGAAITVFVIGVDGAGNFDFCTVMVNVQPGIDPSPCDEDATTTERTNVAGFINTENDNAVAGVEVQLSGGFNDMYITSDNGVFAFEDLIIGYDYTITPHLDEGHINGVSTFDIVVMAKHILGVQPLNSPYKMIAADINKSGSITTLDLIQLRKLVLSISSELSGNTSWRFIPASYVFPDPANPWLEEFPEILNLNNMDQKNVEGDFIAVKVGDVNGNAIANSLMSDVREVAGTFTIQTNEVAMSAGNEYTVEFTAADLATIAGYQFTMNFSDAVSIVEVNYGVAKAENFGLNRIKEGVITTSWNGEASDEVLFSVVLRAKAGANLSDVITIGSRYTAAEAYSNNNENLQVALTFGDEATANAGFEVYQNTPNPFVGETIIGFNLPKAADVTITINNMNGQTLKVINGEYGVGYNQVTVNSADIAATGILYYTVQAGDFTATNKMIIIE